MTYPAQHRALSPEPRAQPSPAQPIPATQVLGQTRSEATDLMSTWIVRPQAECSAWFALPDAAKLAQAGELAPRQGRYVGYGRDAGRRELLELRRDDGGAACPRWPPKKVVSATARPSGLLAAPFAASPSAPARAEAFPLSPRNVTSPQPPPYHHVIAMSAAGGVRPRTVGPAAPALCALLAALEGWAQASNLVAYQPSTNLPTYQPT